MTDKRTTMNGKPVHSVAAKTIINFKSDFGPKLLCDGLTFSTGLSCAYSCSFCYVEAMMRKSPQFDALRKAGASFTDVVMRREGWQETMRSQLMGYRGSKHFRESDRRVIYASPLVDVAANMDLVKETIEACSMILELTHWDIRLLSKSNLLPFVARGLVAKHGHDAFLRVIYGVSTGTLDDGLAASFEVGTAKVSKRIESLHWLQDNGFRTFGMICPSLPQRDYRRFALEMAYALRVEKCEHVWSEVLNVRGESMGRTTTALREAGYDWEAGELERVASGDAWEEYSRNTFLGHSPLYPPGKLRFLQYVNSRNWSWWSERQGDGAVLLGSYAKERKEGE